MVGTMSPVSHIAAGPKETLRPYYGWHPGGSEVTGSEASVRPPPCVHHSRSGMLWFVKMLKSIELVEG